MTSCSSAPTCTSSGKRHRGMSGRCCRSRPRNIWRQLKLKDLIYSGYHPYEGQEAVAVGFCSPLKREDILLSTHRPHCHAVAKGCSIEGVLTEMMGRRTGCSRGIGGAMQFIDVD